MAESIKRKIARECIERFKDTPTLTLAKKLFKESPLLYKNIEDCRDVIRMIRGAHGDRLRKEMADKSLYNTTPKKQYKLPESYAEDRKPLILPMANNNILVISDFHVPYHTNEAIDCAIEYGQQNKVNTLILNGDVLDFYMMSRFEKDPRKRSIKTEFDTCRQLLEYIRHKFPTQDIYWTEGNHDKRYSNWLMTKAPEIFDDPYYSLEERLQLNDLKIKLVDNLTMIMAGKLYIAHGDKWQNGIFSPVNPARGLYMKLKKSALMSHVHNTSQHTEKDVSGGMTSCWSIGCMSELRPDYNPYCNKYNHGFAHVIVNKDKTFTVKNHMIIDGHIH